MLYDDFITDEHLDPMEPWPERDGWSIRQNVHGRVAADRTPVFVLRDEHVSTKPTVLWLEAAALGLGPGEDSVDEYGALVREVRL